MEIIKNIPGENWGVAGKMNTGKTHTTMELAGQIMERSGKPIIVFDHTNNDSYKDIENEITLDDLNGEPLEMFTKYKLVGCTDYEEFCRIATHEVRDSILILDDCSNQFGGNLSADLMAFVTASKNNRNDVFFQFHSFDDIGPKLLRNLQMIVVKQMALGQTPKKLPNYQLVDILHADVIKENQHREPNQKWAYRIYDLYRDIVFYENDQGIVIAEDGEIYFKSKI